MRTRTVTLGAVLAAAMILGPVTASAAPNGAPNLTTVELECAGSTTTLVFHPGLGKAVWDISLGSAETGPDLLIVEITQHAVAGGEVVGDFVFRFGKHTGKGDPMSCDYEEHFTAEDGTPIDLTGVVRFVRTP